MKKEIFINESMGETRIAIQEDSHVPWWSEYGGRRGLRSLQKNATITYIR